MISKLSTIENSTSSMEVEVDELVLDLDYTFFDGMVVRMTDEELMEAPLIGAVVALIHQAKALGKPVKMLTRNTPAMIERFFEAKPETRAFFDEIISSTTKGFDLKANLSKNGKTRALFVDDTPGERADVDMNTEGVRSIDPAEAGNIKLKKPEIWTKEDLKESSRGEVIKLFEKTTDQSERERIQAVLESDFHVDTDQIELAA